jgi:hypothetical protein
MPFDFGQIQDPVPASVYYNARTDCRGTQTHCGTITDDSYSPNLVLKNKVWFSMMPPEAFGCLRPLIVDPPIALKPMRVSSLEEAHIPVFTHASSVLGALQP